MQVLQEIWIDHKFTQQIQVTDLQLYHALKCNFVWTLQKYNANPSDIQIDDLFLN